MRGQLAVAGNFGRLAKTRLATVRVYGLGPGDSGGN